MVDFLTDNASKAAAWAGAQGIDVGDLEDYISALTPLLLTQDTRVTNHGFRSGTATARQSILEAGTAVLVDDHGVPRARCACGNPLDTPTPVSQPAYTGTAWVEFDPEIVAVIQPAVEAIIDFVVRDVATGTGFERPAGTDGSQDEPTNVRLPEPGESVTTTTGTTTTTIVTGGDRNAVLLTIDVGAAAVDIDPNATVEQNVQMSFIAVGGIDPPGGDLDIQDFQGGIDIRISGFDPDNECFLDFFQNGPFQLEQFDVAGGIVNLSGIAPVFSDLGPANECPDDLGLFPIQLDQPWTASWDPATGDVTATLAEVTFPGFAAVLPEGGEFPTTTLVTEVFDITREGFVSASSIFNNSFPVELSIDGDPSTSWFSAGSDADGPASLYGWSGPQDDLIVQIDILSNAGHATPDFRTGFGFDSVTVNIYNRFGDLVFSETHGLGGTPDPDIQVFPSVFGQDVELVFSGHESSDCGGFAELVVIAERVLIS